MKTLLTLVLAIALASCSSYNTTYTSPWTIQVANSGGVTGGTSGCALSNTGEIHKLSGLNGKREVGSTLGKITPEEAEMWAKKLDELGFWKSRLNEVGNMNTSIEMTRGDTMHVVQWSGSTPESTPYADWSAGFLTMCGKLK